jgi:colicin import membrane protein
MAMDSFSDQLKAFGYSVAVHLLCVLLMAIGVAWTRANRPADAAAGPIVEAVLVDASVVAKARAKPPEPKPPEPEKPPVKSEAPNLPPIPKPDSRDRINQERIDRLAEEKARNAEREQDEKRKHEQEVLEQEERNSKLDRDRHQQLEDIRKQRDLAEKRRKLEQEKLAQLEDLSHKPDLKAPPEPPHPQAPGNEGTDTGLRARYVAAIQSVVQQNWLRPDNAQVGLNCRLNITQIPGGEVIEAHVLSPCNADDLTRRSIEAAVLRAQPLPFQGYEKVFERNIVFNFRYDG